MRTKERGTRRVMHLSREIVFQLIGAFAGLAVAFAAIGLGLFAAGRAGVIALIAGVPIGVAFGWALERLLRFLHREIGDGHDDTPDAR